MSTFHTDKDQEKELLRPEELNQQNIEALVAESNLVRWKYSLALVKVW
jgi:hypothetical protein